jgi:hypothetical protein
MSLPWIRLSNDLPDHPKSDALAGLTGEPRAWSHVVELWLWASRVKENGDLAGVADTVIAKRSGWSGDAGAWVEALRSAGFLDPDNRLHGWDDHQGKILDRIEGDRKRKADKRAADRAKLSAGSPADRPQDIPRPSAGNPPLRDETRRDETRRPEEQVHAPGNVPPVAQPPADGQAPSPTTTTGLPAGTSPAPATATRPSSPEAARPDACDPSPVVPDPGNAGGAFAAAGREGLPGILTPSPKAARPRNAPTAAKPRKSEPDPAALAAREAERADGDRWRERAEQRLGYPRAEPWGAAWHRFVAARKDPAIGLDALLRSLDGLAGDDFARTCGLGALLSGAVVSKGLARARAGPGASVLTLGINALLSTPTEAAI